MSDKDTGRNSGHDQTNEITREADGDSSGKRQKTFSRRALLEAGWSVPLIAAVHFPTDAYAVSVPAHVDTPNHSDIPHGDTLDHSDTPHSDGSSHEDFQTFHTDSGFEEFHEDHADGSGPHNDAFIHSDNDPVHGDSTSPHQDTPSTHGDTTDHFDGIPHNDIRPHEDEAHQDFTFGNEHADSNLHNDRRPHVDESPHVDEVFSNAHEDTGTPHTDVGGHGDTTEPHVDSPHADGPNEHFDESIPHNDEPHSDGGVFLPPPPPPAHLVTATPVHMMTCLTPMSRFMGTGRRGAAHVGGCSAVPVPFGGTHRIAISKA